MRSFALRLGVPLALAGGAACSQLGLGTVIQPPQFQVAEGRQAELRLLLPSADRPRGGASVRLWAHVTNPNAFGLTLAALSGSLFLERTRAADVDFPMGLPLHAQQDTVIPLDLTVSFSDLPDLAGIAARAVTGSRLAYTMDGTVTVDAGVLGRPSFGPSTLLRGELQVRR